MKSMNKKHVLIAAAVAGIAIIAGGSMLSSSGKKQALGYYDEFKEQFHLEGALSEGEVSYSFWSGNLTVDSPEIRLVAVQTNGAEKLLKGIASMLSASGEGAAESGLSAWSRYLMTSATGGGNAGGVYLKADALKVGRSGESKDGEIHVQLLGLDMSNPYLSHKGSELILVSDVGDEIQPRADIDQYGRVVNSNLSWGSNIVSRLPFTGSFLTGATGEIGTKVNLDFTLKRSSDGEGKAKFVVVHLNDGSEIGRVVREAKFASVGELDDVQGQLRGALEAFIMGAYSTSMGQAGFAVAAGNFAKKTKVASYTLTYEGFDQLKDGFDVYQAATKQKEFAGYCAEAGLSTFQNDFGVKGKGHNDSECGIAQKLAADGKFEENYTFKEDKSLFAGLFVSKSYTLETN